MNLVKQVPKTQVREVPKQVGRGEGCGQMLAASRTYSIEVGVPVFQCHERVVEAAGFHLPKSLIKMHHGTGSHCHGC